MEIIAYLLVLFIFGFFSLFLFSIIYSISKFIVKKIDTAKKRKEQKREHEEWLNNIEPQFRDVKGYPPDWEKRRCEVFIRSYGICYSCDTSVGMLLGGKFLCGAHVHHIQPISQGGNHSISNLELLCEDCHVEKHPDNKGMRTERNWRNLYIGQAASIKIAKKGWNCAICEKLIRVGESTGRPRCTELLQ